MGRLRLLSVKAGGDSQGMGKGAGEQGGGEACCYTAHWSHRPLLGLLTSLPLTCSRVPPRLLLPTNGACDAAETEGLTLLTAGALVQALRWAAHIMLRGGR